jgi:hypothetical protein
MFATTAARGNSSRGRSACRGIGAEPRPVIGHPTDGSGVTEKYRETRQPKSARHPSR